MFVAGLDHLSAQHETIRAIRKDLSRNNFELKLAAQSGDFSLASLFGRHQVLLELGPKVHKRHLLLDLELVKLALELLAFKLLFVALSLLTFLNCRRFLKSILALFLRFYQLLPNGLEKADGFVTLFFLVLR